MERVISEAAQRKEGYFVSFGRWLARQQSREKLNDTELAALMRVDRVTIHKWKYGKTSPRPEHIERLAGVLHLPQEDIYGALNRLDLPKELPDDVRGIVVDLLQVSPKVRRGVALLLHTLVEDALPDGDGGECVGQDGIGAG